MVEERWSHVDQLLQSALEMPAEERDTFSAAPVTATNNELSPR